MKFLFGLFIGLLLAIGIAVGAGYMAFGDLSNIGERDKSKDITQTFDLAGFDRIDAGGVYELDVSVGGDFSVTISGASEEMARLEADVENGELSLGQKRPEHGKRRWRNSGLTAVISLPALNAIDISGVVDGEVTGIAAASFSADLSGVGDLELSGTCENLTADISGVGDFDGRDLECETVEVHVSGVGDASVYASQSVDASVSGIGSISVYGSPSQVEKSSSFLSSISVQ